MLTLTLLQNLCFTKKSISVAMGSPAHIDFGGSSALQLTSPLRSQTYERALQSTGWDMQPPQVSHLVCMGSSTHKSLICHLPGLCSQHKFYLSFTRALQPTFAVHIPGYISREPQAVFWIWWYHCSVLDLFSQSLIHGFMSSVNRASRFL